MAEWYAPRRNACPKQYVAPRPIGRLSALAGGNPEDCSHRLPGHARRVLGRDPGSADEGRAMIRPPLRRLLDLIAGRLQALLHAGRLAVELRSVGL